MKAEDRYSVVLMYDYGNQCGGIPNMYFPVLIGEDREKAEKITKMLDKYIDAFDLRDDYDDSGFFVMYMNNTYCTNHKEFEKIPTLETLEFFEKNFFDLKKHIISAL